MKVTNKTTDSSETSVDIDLFEGQKLPARVKKRINEEVGDFLVDQTLISIEREQSPVSGQGSFKALSPNYKKLKLKEVGNARPNLEADGDMKDQISYVANSKTLTIGVFGDRAGAADGHNNLSGKSKLTRRQFLPDEGQTYKRDIVKEIERIKADIIAEETTFKPSQFRNVSTSKDLYDTLKNLLNLDTRSEVNLAVIRNPDLEDFLKEEGLYDLLRF